MTGVTNSKLLPQRMPALNSPKQNMHAPTKAELAHCTTSASLSKYAQSQKLSSLTRQKYWIFPHGQIFLGLPLLSCYGPHLPLPQSYTKGHQCTRCVDDNTIAGPGNDIEWVNGVRECYQCCRTAGFQIDPHSC